MWLKLAATLLSRAGMEQQQSGVIQVVVVAALATMGVVLME
jgi:hypothetical protein